MVLRVTLQKNGMPITVQIQNTTDDEKERLYITFLQTRAKRCSLGWSESLPLSVCSGPPDSSDEVLAPLGWSHP